MDLLPQDILSLFRWLCLNHVHELPLPPHPSENDQLVSAWNNMEGEDTIIRECEDGQLAFSGHFYFLFIYSNLNT